MDEFIIKGSAFDKSSWQFSRHLAPVPAYQTMTVDFGTDEALGFLRSGWDSSRESSKDGLTFQWGVGDSASIFLSFPKDEYTWLTANVKTFLKSQKIAVKVDGKEIASWEISPSWRWEKHSVTIGPDKDRPDVSVIEFMFSQYRNPEDKGLRPLAVLFESITLTKLKSYEWGTPIYFGKSGQEASYEVDGWSQPSKHSTWIDGVNATLKIPVSVPESASIKLKAEFFPFIVPGKVETQTVIILINGKKAGKWIIKEKGLQERTLDIPRRFIGDTGLLKITFNTPDAISPAEIGYNKDKRVLGIAFRSLQLDKSAH